MKEEDKLLLEIFEKEKMTFREVFPLVIPNPNRAQTILTELIKKKLIQQENKNWRPGQKKSYSLTEKGLLQCNKLDINRINESIKRLQKTSSVLLAPNNLQRLRQEGHVPFPKRWPVNTDPNAPASISYRNEEEQKEFFEHKEKVFGELRRVFFDLAKILIEVEGRAVMAEDDLSNMEVRFRNKRPSWTALPDARYHPKA